MKMAVSQFKETWFLSQHCMNAAPTQGSALPPVLSQTVAALAGIDWNEAGKKRMRGLFCSQTCNSGHLNYQGSSASCQSPFFGYWDGLCGCKGSQDVMQGTRLIKTYSTSVFQRHLLPLSNSMGSRLLKIKVLVFSRMQVKDWVLSWFLKKPYR